MQDGPGNRVGELPAAAKAWWSARFARCAADELACEFFAALDVRGLSRNTLIAYGRPSKISSLFPAHSRA